MSVPKAGTSAFVRAALSKKKPVRCWTCNLPPNVLRDVHDAREAGASLPGIAQALVEQHKINPGEATRIKNHFNLGHHRRDAE